jgi:hypothetical protein
MSSGTERNIFDDVPKNPYFKVGERLHRKISVLWCCEGGLNSRPRHYQCVFQFLRLALTHFDGVVRYRLTDCYFNTFFLVGLAWCSIWLALVVLRSPTNPLLVTLPHERRHGAHLAQRGSVLRVSALMLTRPGKRSYINNQRCPSSPTKPGKHGKPGAHPAP